MKAIVSISLDVIGTNISDEWMSNLNISWWNHHFMPRLMIFKPIGTYYSKLWKTSHWIHNDVADDTYEPSIGWLTSQEAISKLPLVSTLPPVQTKNFQGFELLPTLHFIAEQLPCRNLVNRSCRTFDPPSFPNWDGVSKRFSNERSTDSR